MGNGEDLADGFDRAEIQVTGADGSATPMRVLVADDMARWRRGLTGVTDPDLGGHDGMLFVFPRQTLVPVSMRNTRLPLTVVFLDSAGVVRDTADLEPLVEDSPDYRGYLPSVTFKYALEVVRGRASRFGLEPGVRVDLGPWR